MTLEAFGKSDPLTLGVELELQLVNTVDYDLTHYADNMLRLMAGHALPGSVVPEMTAGMIEISTDVCRTWSEARGQLGQIRDALVKCADKLNVTAADAGEAAARAEDVEIVVGLGGIAGDTEDGARGIDGGGADRRQRALQGAPPQLTVARPEPHLTALVGEGGLHMKLR